MATTKEELIKAKREIEAMLEEEYSYVLCEGPNLSGEKLFTAKDGHVFHIDMIPKFECLVIEHADSIKNAEDLLLEDGDLYRPQDHSNIKSMYSLMLKEINS